MRAESHPKADTLLAPFRGIIDDVKLTSRVPELMRTRGIRSVSDLKRRSGLGYATCWRMAAGQLPSRVSTIAALATALDVTPGDLFKPR